MYDWANSAFATTVMAAFLPIYYSQVAASQLSGNVATAYWGYTTAIALAIVAVISPVLGAIADYMGGKKRFLAVFMGFGVTSTALLWFIGDGDWLLASLIFIVANVGFAGANVFYEALLPSVAGDDDLDRVSIAGYAYGNRAHQAR
jgi:UMF1 family MFS transporter